MQNGGIKPAVRSVFGDSVFANINGQKAHRMHLWHVFQPPTAHVIHAIFLQRCSLRTTSTYFGHFEHLLAAEIIVRKIVEIYSRVSEEFCEIF